MDGDQDNTYKVVDSKNATITWTYFGIMIGMGIGVYSQLPAHDPWWEKFPCAFLVGLFWPIVLGLHLAGIK